ncbi:MAG: dTDP-glucose 4,6-dehydratase [Candidatus Cloacimonadota bacterium]|nr:MAG: dTDP-glucose 4,6-dehydratase [Candidatus Cloacimonadota bacterium]
MSNYETGLFNFFDDGESNTSSKIVLVTGGAGFIGSNFIRFLLKKYPDYKIINFDKLTYAGNLNNLVTIEENPHYVFVRGDVANVKDVKNVFEEFNPHFVVHFAAESHVDRSILNPDIFLQTNILGTQNLLNHAREHQIEKFVQISTDEVYGSIGKGESCHEESPLCPNNPYAASKASADFLIRVAHQTYGQRVNIVRSCNNYGTYQFPEKLIPVMIYNSLINEELPVYGDGRNIREWIHVEDNCRAIDLVLHNGRSGEIYNVGTGEEWENVKLAEFLLKQFPESKSHIQFVLDRQGHDFRYSVKTDKIKKELGWKPQIDFKEGIEQTILWYKSHLDWIEQINSGEYMQYFKETYESRLTESN